MKRFIVMSALLALAACGGDTGTSGSTVNGTLQIEDLVIGTGATAAAGNLVTVHYIGTLTNGTKFDSSYDRGGPLGPFRLGAGQYIPGFEQGIVGMKVGGKRRLTIPPNLAYGAGGNPAGGIPGNATVIFEVDLVAVS